MAALIVYIVFGLFPIYKAFQVRRDPMKSRNLRKMKALQPDAELPSGIQEFYFVNYLIAGILWMLTGVIGWLFGMELTYVMLALAIIGGFALFIAKWQIMGIASKWHLVVLALAVVLFVSYSLWMFRDGKVEVLPETICIEGDYGTEIHYQAIDSVLVVNALPDIRYCKEGHGFVGGRKGVFRLKDGSDAKFYLLDKKAPYLKMYTKFGLILVNRKTPEETGQLIEELKEKIGNKMVNL
jgi:hypothetical protein